jgi:hypothetical protein
MIKILNNKLVLAAATTVCAASLFTFSAANANEDPFTNSATTTNLMLAGHHGDGKGHRMKMMDTDGDGVISKDEFMSHKEQKFNKKDENGDGVISEDEMQKHCKHHKDKTPKEE